MRVYLAVVDLIQVGVTDDNINGFLATNSYCLYFVFLSREPEGDWTTQMAK